MWSRLKNLIRPLVPRQLFRTAQPFYHGAAALLAHQWFGRPSRRLFVIGVTGTGGKSTTIIALAHILNSTGHKTGYRTTAESFDGEQGRVNKVGLSMSSGYILHKSLKQMADNGCDYAIIECTSEGLQQNRHLGIRFQMALLTNLSPAHIDAHGSFTNYRAAKEKLFAALKGRGLAGVNLDDENSSAFLRYPAKKQFGITTHAAYNAAINIHTYFLKNITSEPAISFTINNVAVTSPLIGQFNVYNLSLALAAVDMLSVPLNSAARTLTSWDGAQGRMQRISNSRDLTIIIDYAPEPKPLELSLRAAGALPHRRLIHVFGATGGHRDVSKRFEFGRLAAKLANTIIITNDDVYDTDPQAIINDIQNGINEVSDKKADVVLAIPDRRAALARALELAQPQDIVLITGKGSEQFLVLPGNRRIPWEDASVVRELLDGRS